MSPTSIHFHRRPPQVPGVVATVCCLLGVLIGGCGRHDAATDSAAPVTETDGRSAGAVGSAEGAALDIEPVEVPPEVLDSLRTALAAYEDVRARLAVGSIEDLAPRAERLARSLRAAQGPLDRAADPSGGTFQVAAFGREAAAAAASLARADQLDSARTAFGELSRSLIAMVAADPRLAVGLEVYSCPMTSTFPKWLQPTGELDNPYMGPGMSSCGAVSDWTVPTPDSRATAKAHAEEFHGDDQADHVSHWTCSMHPSVRADQPGTCPICSMDLVPVSREEVATGIFVVDARRRQEIGVRTAPVGREPVTTAIRAVGTVVYDETRLSEVSVKYRGWIGRLWANETGELVRRGEPLFELYSPELYAAQAELIAALDSQRNARDTSAPHRADYLVEAARQRLRLWDLQESQIERVEDSGEPLKYLPITSPASGYVIEKLVVEGAAVEPGETLLRLAALDRIWVEADVYESELPLVELGQTARITFPYLPGRTFEGAVSLIHPQVHDSSRTGRVRVELANPDLELKPEMYANVELVADRGERLVVPTEAVIYTGSRRLVFVDLGEGRLQPREIATGIRTGDHYEVLWGLDAGEVVVTSGNFLIAAESRLKSATELWH